MKNIVHSFLLVFALFLTGCTDITPPVITLTGSDVVTLTVGEEYIEQGATATDNIDTVVDVNISSNVDTSTAGTYTVTYTAKDLAGNEATPRTRTVRVNAPQNIAPTASITVSSTEATVGTAVHFSSEESSDEDGQIVRYEWKDDAENILSEDSNFAHTFTRAGRFGVKLIVIDNDNAHSTTIVHINVTENNDTNISDDSIVGTITNINGTAIAGASVTIGSQTVITDASGHYSFVNVTHSQRVKVNVSHPDYLANSRIIVASDTEVTLNIKLGAPKASLTFDSASGGLVSHDGASVDLPANAYVDSNGTAYTGEVTVNMSYYPITTQSGRAAFPGTFEGIDDNTTFPIQSYGFMNVELADANGNALNLDGNGTATLTFPRDYNIFPQPDIIPLWYYDAVQGYWVQEGEASRVGSTYVGTVTHFTSWNLDAKGPKAEFTGCVEDENGTRVSGASVFFRAANWDSYIVPTDTNGTISVYNILAEADLTFSAYKQIGTQWFYGEHPSIINLTEGESRTLPDCIVLAETNLPDGNIQVKGRIVDMSGNAIPNAQFILLNSTPIAVDASGNFDITIPVTDNLLNRIGRRQCHALFRLQSNKTVYDLGDVQICE